MITTSRDGPDYQDKVDGSPVSWPWNNPGLIDETSAAFVKPAEGRFAEGRPVDPPWDIENMSEGICNSSHTKWE